MLDRDDSPEILPFDDLPIANCKRKRSATLVAGIELGAIRCKSSPIMHLTYAQSDDGFRQAP